MGMDTFSNVFQFLKSARAGDQHRRALNEALLKSQENRNEEIDMRVLENAAISECEKNIFSSLEMVNKWVFYDMYRSLLIEGHSLAKQDGGDGKGSVSNCTNFTIDWLPESEQTIQLLASEYNTHNSRREGLGMRRDDALRRRLLTCCANLSVSVRRGVVPDVVAEKINSTYDMKHMFVKGLLYLYGYNLAVSSDIRERRKGQIGCHCVNNADGVNRLEAMVKHSIVVDTISFTPQQTKMLGMMASQYPCVEYVPDSIYSNIDMDADDLVLISSGDVMIQEGYDFTDPDNMYYNLIEIAIKMEALDDFEWAIRNTRGLAKWIDKYSATVDRYDHDLKIRRSKSMVRALDECEGWRGSVTNKSNYLATTKSLVADLFLGEAMFQNMYNLVETFGVLGDFGCPSKKPATDDLFISHLRDYGVKNGYYKVNAALQHVMAVADCGNLIAYSDGLYEMCKKIATKMMAGRTFTMPMINFDIPMSSIGDNAWSVARGWSVTPSGMRDQKETSIIRNARSWAMAWCMGMTDKIPKVGLNMIGMSQHEVAEFGDMHKLALTEGCYRITKVEYRIGDDVIGRTDVTEVCLLRETEFLGSRCSYIRGDGGRAVKEQSTLTGRRADEVTRLGSSVGKKVSVIEPELALVDDDIVSPPVQAKHLASNQNTSFTQYMEKTNAVWNARPPIVMGEVDVLLKNQYSRKGNEYTEVLQVDDADFNVGDDVKIDRIETSGTDLMCGLQAVCQDLQLHGLVEKANAEQVFTMLMDQLGPAGNFDAQEIALLLNTQGIGLAILQEDGKNGVRVTKYGAKDAKHVCKIWLKDNHFENVVIGAGDDVRISRVDEGTTLEASIANLRNYADVFGTGKSMQYAV